MSQVPIPYGLGASTSLYPEPGEVYSVDNSTSWRNEHRYCRYYGYIMEHQSLIYHFSDGSSGCYYDFITRDRHGCWCRHTRRVEPGANPFRFAWDNGISYWRVQGTPDAALCGVFQSLRGKGIVLTGWEIPQEELNLLCFIQKRSAGSHYLDGEIAYCRVANDDSETVYRLGSLKDAATALSYLQNILHMTVAEAAKELKDEAEAAFADMEADLEMQEALFPRNWVDSLDPEIQDFADQFETEEDFDEYMESRM